MLLSILVPTVPGREMKLTRLLGILDRQLLDRPNRDVELLVLRDSRTRSIGKKRNAMLSIALGQYAAFVDDDDLPEPDYVHSLCEAAQNHAPGPPPDVICFEVRVTGYGVPRICKYHPTFTHADLPDGYRRKPNHIMCFRTELAKSVPFPDVAYGEDTLWAQRMESHLITVAQIPRVLYTYAFDHADNSRTPR